MLAPGGGGKLEDGTEGKSKDVVGQRVCSRM